MIVHKRSQNRPVDILSGCLGERILLLIYHMKRSCRQRYPHLALAELNNPCAKIFAFILDQSGVKVLTFAGDTRKRSPAGMSVRLTRERSRVRAPSLPLMKLSDLRQFFVGRSYLTLIVSFIYELLFILYNMKYHPYTTKHYRIHLQRKSNDCSQSIRF